MSPRVFSLHAASSSAAVTLNPAASRASTKTGVAPARRICSGYETQYGVGTSTSSPGPNSAMTAQ
jgi:hypothetical protein